MPDNTERQALIDTFLAALEQRDLDGCAAAVASLEARGSADPEAADWCCYLRGVLANERDRDWGAAERIFRELLARPVAPALRGRALLALGLTCDYQGRWAEAITAYEESLPLFAALGQRLDQARAWKNLSLALFSGYAQGEFGAGALRRAADHCRQALAALAGEDDPWLEGAVWNTLGAVHMHLRQWDEAIACYERDLAICRAQDDRFGIGLALNNLGEVYQQRGAASWPAALAAYQEARAIVRAFDNGYEEADILANLALLHQEMGDDDQALACYDAAIGLIETLRAGASSAEARAGFFATTVDTYASAALLCARRGLTGRAFDYVERARSRAFLDTLAARSAALPPGAEARPLSLAQVQAALPEGALLLAYFTTGLIEAADEGAAAPRRHRFPPAHTLLFAISRTEAVLHDLGLSPNTLRPARLDGVVERHFLKPRIRRTLYERLLAPAAAAISAARQILIVPHGPLHYIPFQALIGPGGQTLLDDGGPQIVYGPGATLLLAPRPAGAPPIPPAAAPPLPMLALGSNGDGPVRLRFAEDEAYAVARLTGGETLVGPGSRAELLARAHTCRLLHLSCHGSFEPAAPLDSALHLGAGERLTALDILAQLRLRCELVTLSACESGLSRVRRGDELAGLAHAFLFAGAAALVCTLWRVDERSTRILMEMFYERLQQGMGVAAALQGSQLALRRLSRRAAREWLLRSLARELLQRRLPAASGATPAPPGALKRDGEGAATDTLLHGPDDEPVFADAMYWAPFILIGGAR